jgi:putative CocE/NonD family hydrolase
VGYNTRGSPEIQGKQLLQMGGIGHGALVGEIPWPNATAMPIVDNEQFLFQSELEEKYGARGTSGYEAAWQKRTKVQFYVFGDPASKDPLACRWQLSPDWPPKQAKTVEWYLSAGPNPHQGVLSLSPPTTATKATFQYDPIQPCPTNGGNNLFAVSYVDGSKIGQGSCDQRGGGSSGAAPVSTRADVLSFWSPVLSTPLEYAGMVSALLYVQSDRPDTDFVVKLVDVFPDGRQMLVSDGIVRACRYQGLNTTNWLQPGNTYKLEVQVGSKAWRFGVNHRVMVLVTSSNFPRFQRNVNMPQENIPLLVTKSNSAVATNSIIMSPGSPSAITFSIPVYTTE